jgi:hypothetical protein
MTYYEKINKLKWDFFGSLTFEQLENIFNVQLFGLSIEDTERELKSLRDEWVDCDWNAVVEIMQEYDKEINN